MNNNNKYSCDINRPNFRTDINGLRAWAVIAVIFYHFGIPGFTGGFIGVDVFFVISGFLMTGIIFNGLQSNNFSILTFYLSRARRILPALIVLSLMLLILGWWFLIPIDYRFLSSRALFTILFLSNFKFWREAGYFDSASDEKWQLHTWSLSVEWQFYLILPLLMVFVWKWLKSKYVLILGIAIISLISLFLCIYLTLYAPATSFYLLPFRAWEMLAGSIVYFFADRWSLNKKQRYMIELCGFTLIILSIFLFNKTTSWPGWRALLPVIGASMVIFALRPKSALTTNSVAQWFGSRSYSLYLWHWPVLVTLVYLQRKSDSISIFFGLLITLILGQLSYSFVELTSQTYLARQRKLKSAILLFFGVFLVLALAQFIYYKNGIYGRFSSDIETLAAEKLNTNSRQSECHVNKGADISACMHGGTNLKAIVIGDSHANAVVSAVASATINSSDGVLELTHSGCPIVEGVHRLGSESIMQCAEFINNVFKKLEMFPREIPLVVVARDTSYLFGVNEEVDNIGIPLVYFTKQHEKVNTKLLDEYQSQYRKTFCELAKYRSVYIVHPIPEMKVDVPSVMARARVFGAKREISISIDDYRERHRWVIDMQNQARDQCGVKILDPVPYICSQSRCSGVHNNRPIYYDDDHLSEYGNKLLIPMFKDIFIEPYELN